MEDGFELLTDRLRLRPYRPEDVDLLHPLFSDPEHMRFYPDTYSSERSEEWVARQLASSAEHRYGLWIVEERAAGGFLGTVGPTLQVVEGVEEVELGWHIRKDRWGEGIAPEAAVASRDWCWANLDVDHLISLVRPENDPSARVAEKIGMHLDRIAPYKGLAHSVYRIDRPA